MTSLRRDPDVIGAAVRTALQAAEAEADLAVEPLDGQRFLVRRQGRTAIAHTLRDGDVTYVALDGRTYEVRDPDAEAAVPGAGLDGSATSPMTGVLAKVTVAAGDAVAAGAELFVVEAMKMEYVVRAPRDVVVAHVAGAAGDAVDLGDEIVRFAAADDAAADGDA